MKRSRLKNKANKSGKEEDKRLYNIQRNKVSKLNNKLTKTYSGTTVNLTLQTRALNDRMTGNRNNDNRITLDENDEILNEDSEISETFNNYFVNITKDLGIFHWADDSSNS